MTKNQPLTQTQHLEDKGVLQGDIPEGLIAAAPVTIRRSSGGAGGRRTVWRGQSDFDNAELLWDRETGLVSRLDTHFPEEAQVLSPVTPMAFTATDLPGVKKDDINIRIDGNLVQIDHVAAVNSLEPLRIEP